MRLNDVLLLLNKYSNAIILYTGIYEMEFINDAV